MLQEVTASGITGKGRMNTFIHKLDVEPVEIGTSAYRIVREPLRVTLIAKVFEWIGPEQVAHWPECGWLFEAIQLEGKSS